MIIFVKIIWRGDGIKIIRQFAPVTIDAIAIYDGSGCCKQPLFLDGDGSDG
jgi:hypothetical protein